MEQDVTVLPAEADFDAFLREHAGERGFKHVVVTRGNHVAGVVRVNICGAASRRPTRA